MGFKEENPGYLAKQCTTIANVCWPNRAIEFFGILSFLFFPPFFQNFFLCPFFFYFLNFPLFVRFFKIYFYFFQKIFQFTFHFNLLFSILFLRQNFNLKTGGVPLKIAHMEDGDCGGCTMPISKS